MDEVEQLIVIIGYRTKNRIHQQFYLVEPEEAVELANAFRDPEILATSFIGCPRDPKDNERWLTERPITVLFKDVLFIS